MSDEFVPEPLHWWYGDQVFRRTDRAKSDLGEIIGRDQSEGLFKVRFRSDDPDDPDYDWWKPSQLVLVRRRPIRR